MEDIEQVIRQQQWLAKDRFNLSCKEGVERGVNIFDLYSFGVCKFTLFETLLSKLDNDSLCQAYDYFEGERLRAFLEDHVNKTVTPIDGVGKIVLLYIRTLLEARSTRSTASDIPSIRAEITMYSKIYPHMDSNVLTSEFQKSGVEIVSR